MFSHFPTGKTFFFFIFLSCIFVNYKYLLEKRGEGDFLLWLYLRLREMDSKEKL